jgi:hypothetical protein
MSTDLFQQGVDAFQAGDKARTKEIMLQVTAAEPNNENAWYYLAAAETDKALRRQYLERVLQINPNHQRARDVLAKLNAREGVAAPPAPAAAEAPRATPIRPLDPAAGETPGGDPTSGFVLPVSIPGAPSQVSPQSLFKGGLELFQKGFDVLMRKAGVYEEEVARATWWRFWLLVGFGFVITAVLSTLTALFVWGRFNFLYVLLTLIFTIPVGLITIYAGVYASHWWAKRQGGQLALYQHAYAVALPYVPAWVFGAVLRLVFSFFLSGIAGLVSLAVSIYALYIMALGFERLYGFSDPNQKWFTVAAMFVGFIVVGFVIAAVLGAIFGVGAFVMF